MVCACAGQSQDTTNVTEVTLSSDTDGTDVDKGNDTDEVQAYCDWEISGTKQLRVFWSGNASTDSVVSVVAQQLSDGTADCRNGSVQLKQPFSKEGVDLPTCPNTMYDISVELDCWVSESQRPAWSPPDPPRNISIDKIGNTSFSVVWDKPSGQGPIELYTIDVTTDTPFGNDHWQLNSTEQKAELSGLHPHTVYEVRMAAKNADFWSGFSEKKIVETKAGIPPVLENLKETAVTNTSVSLEWDAPSPSVGPILKYLVRCHNSSGTFQEYTPSNDTSYTVTHLAPFVWYTFSVAAESEAGSGNESEKLSLRTSIGIPYVPENLTETFVGNTSISLQWEEPPISTGPILSYRLRWQEREEDVASNATLYTIEGLSPYIEYTLRILAVTQAGQGAWSTEKIVRTTVGVPHPPVNVSVTSSTNSSVSLRWDPPPVTTGPILEYQVHWKGSTREGQEPSKQPSHTVKNLEPYMTYTFKVLAVTEAGPGPWSEEISGQTDIGVPHAPRDLTAAKVTNTTVELTWKEPPVSTGPVMGYRVLWKSPGGRGEEETKNLHYTVQHLAPYVDYSFRVLALTSAGPGDWSNEVNTRTEIGVPNRLEKFSVSSVSNTSVQLTWDDPLVSTGPILRYRVMWRNSSGSGEEETNVTPHTLEWLTPYVEYKLKVLALTEAGPGPWSSELTVRTNIGVPHPPSHVRSSHVTNTSALVQWSEPLPNTGPILSFTVRWDSSFRGGGGRSEVHPQRCSFSATDLQPYLEYTFSVSAVTEAGRGQWSENILVHTDIGVPSKPKNFQDEHRTNTSLFLRWERPEFPNAPQLNYTLTYHLHLTKEVKASSVMVSASADQETIRHVIDDLLPYTYYSIRVSASSPAGASPATDEHIVQTKIGVPLPAKILEVKAVKRRRVVVHWSTPGPYPGPVDYTLESFKAPGPCEDKQVTKVMKGNQRAEEWLDPHRTELGDMSPFAAYQFKIGLKTTATDDIVYSRISDTIRIAPEAPSEPLDFRAECTGSPTDLSLSWNPPSEPNGLITSYRIQYGVQRPNSSRLIYVHNMCQRQSYVLKGLRPEKRYLIYVSARVENVSEDGMPAQPRRVCMLPPGIPFLGDSSRLQAAGSTPDSLELVWSKETFSDYMGEIVRYAVLVGRRNTLGNATSGKSATAGPPWTNFSSGVSHFYQATPPGWNPFQDDAFDPLKCVTSREVLDDGSNGTLLRCVVGVDKNCPGNETYCNGPLEPDTPYEMKIRAFTRGGFTETDLIYARSRPVPLPSVWGKIVSVLFALFLVVSLFGGLYFAKNKGHLDVFILRIRSHLNPKEAEASTEDPPIPMEECTSPRPVKMKCFAEHVRIMMSDSHLKFSLEFERLKNESPKLPCSIAEMEENRSKNRWMNIFPFDHSRVKLLPLCDEPCSDFINANYIPGYSSRREYIATQGPLPHVLDDFWRMVWEQSVNMIVMLTQCVERGKKKCEKYWPDSGETSYYGDLRLTTVSVSMLSSYIIRIFHVQSGSYERLVKQMHFTHWPDFGCPESPVDLINFVNAVREHLPRVDPGPILVHCSAGVGRTGTFISVDRLMLQILYSTGDTVDVYGTVLDLRQHRTNMVQTEDQYIYIHLCVRQLIEERDRPPVTGSKENIYSNITIQRNFLGPTAPESPL